MNRTDLKWYDTLESMFGTVLTDRQVEVWQVYLRKQAASSQDLSAAIEWAGEKDLKPIGWRVTVRDLCRWLGMHRQKLRMAGIIEKKCAAAQRIIDTWRAGTLSHDPSVYPKFTADCCAAGFDDTQTRSLRRRIFDEEKKVALRPMEEVFLPESAAGVGKRLKLDF